MTLDPIRPEVRRVRVPPQCQRVSNVAVERVSGQNVVHRLFDRCPDDPLGRPADLLVRRVQVARCNRQPFQMVPRGNHLTIDRIVDRLVDSRGSLRPVGGPVSVLELRGDDGVPHVFEVAVRLGMQTVGENVELLIESDQQHQRIDAVRAAADPLLLVPAHQPSCDQVEGVLPTVSAGPASRRRDPQTEGHRGPFGFPLVEPKVPQRLLHDISDRHVTAGGAENRCIA